MRAYYLSELQLGGGAPPYVSEDLLGLLIEVVALKAAHTHRVHRQIAKSSRERQMAGYAREERSFAAHAACGNAERRRRGLHHTRAAAAERCLAHERRALAIALARARIARASTRNTNDTNVGPEEGPNSLNFVCG